MNTKSPGEFLKTEVLKGVFIGFVLALVVPFVSGILWPTPVPSLDANTQAYILIKNGLNEGRYSTAKGLFDQAYSLTDDSELRYLADYFSRVCELALNSGIETHEEGNSLEGGVKGFIDGFTKPLDGLSAWILMAKEWFGDVDKDADDADQHYQPIIQAYIAADEANKNASYFNWWFFIGTPLAFALTARYKIGTKVARSS